MCSPRTTLGDTRPPPHLEATNQGPEASRPTSTPLLLRRLAEGTCMGVRAPPYSSELSQRPARRRIGQGVVQSDPNISIGQSRIDPQSAPSLSLSRGDTGQG